MKAMPSGETGPMSLPPAAMSAAPAQAVSIQKTCFAESLCLWARESMTARTMDHV